MYWFWGIFHQVLTFFVLCGLFKKYICFFLWLFLSLILVMFFYLLDFSLCIFADSQHVTINYGFDDNLGQSVQFQIWL